MTATAADYPWVFEWNHGLMSLGYCLTFIRELTPDEVLDRWGVRQREHIQGALPIAERAAETWDSVGSRELFVAVTPADGWSVMFEWNGFAGVTQWIMAPVSAGTSTVSHYLNALGVSHFMWLEDGEVVLSFEPLFPFRRLGSRADDLGPEMVEAGFDLREGPERTFDNPTGTAFALAERITNVRVTPSFLEGAIFVGARIPVAPPG